MIVICDFEFVIGDVELVNWDPSQITHYKLQITGDVPNHPSVTSHTRSVINTYVYRFPLGYATLWDSGGFQYMLVGMGFEVLPWEVGSMGFIALWCVLDASHVSGISGS